MQTIEGEIKNSSELGPPEAYRNEGEYTVIDSETGEVKRGEYFVDTRLLDPDTPSAEWESMLRLKPENAVIVDEEDPYSVNAAYRREGAIFRLLSQKDDPFGERAKEVHDHIVNSVQKNIPADQIEKEVTNYIKDLEYN